MIQDSTAGYQRWSDLTFLHWRVPADAIQVHLPRGLAVETFDGSAWIGLVPFSMERVRPWWSPPVPGISWFLETNIRTYVRTEDGHSGVWFFSLDANSRLAVAIARKFWNLPYLGARLSLSRQATTNQGIYICYEGRRWDEPPAGYEIKVNIPSEKPIAAALGTLEHFLVERYTLFCVDGYGRMHAGQVHHAPYLIQSVGDIQVRQTLMDAIIPHGVLPNLPDHAAFSPGVDVRVSPIRRI
jgi:uncharacterized protein YqjF (DUF2071 family)